MGGVRSKGRNGQQTAIDVAGRPASPRAEKRAPDLAAKSATGPNEQFACSPSFLFAWDIRICRCQVCRKTASKHRKKQKRNDIKKKKTFVASRGWA